MPQSVVLAHLSVVAAEMLLWADLMWLSSWITFSIMCSPSIATNQSYFLQPQPSCPRPPCHSLECAALPASL